MEDYKSNFGLSMPTDISRYPDGTPHRFVSHEDKVDFTKWLNENSIGVDAFEKLQGAEKDKIFVDWKNKKHS